MNTATLGRGAAQTCGPAGPCAAVGGRGEPAGDADVRAAVTIAVDADDDYGYTRAVLGLHDPARGRVVVHPTPGGGGLLRLAHDVLVAVGKDPACMKRVRTPAEAWRQASAWICGGRIREVVVLRAHLLERSALARLIQLAADTGAAVTLIWHTRPPADWAQALPAATLAVLDDVQEAFVQARARLGPLGGPPAAQPMYCRARTPPAGADAGAEAVAQALQRPLPQLPVAELPRFRTELRRRLASGVFARADALYAAGMDSACAFLTDHPGYRRPDDKRPGRRRPAPEPPAGLPAPQCAAAPATGEAATGEAAISGGEEGRAAGAVPARHDRAETPARRDAGAAREASARDASEPGLELRLVGYPVPWQDTDALDTYLVSLLSASTSAEHTMVLLRGAQAEFLLHGLPLAVPPDPARFGGPGFADVPLTRQVADQIRGRTLDPVRAVALALLLASGLNAADLAGVRVRDLAEDASVIMVGPLPWRSPGSRLPFVVPVHARDLLAAARAYAALSGEDDLDDPLLASGLGYEQQLVFDTARACGLPVEDPDPWRQSRKLWHARARCLWVADPLHGNLSLRPEQELGYYVPPA